MQARLTLTAAALAIGVIASAQTTRAPRLNPIIELLRQNKPVFGVTLPAAPARGAAPKSAAELARDTVAFTKIDFVFSNSMEAGVDRGLTAFAGYMSALGAAGALVKAPAPRLTHPVIVRTPRIATDPAKAIDDISRQLNLGVSGIMFGAVESADEVRQGIAAMRFASTGGTRPAGVGTAPRYWGMTDAQYRAKADLWPSNPDGELINWTVIETKAGVARVRDIAAVKGIGVLWAGEALRQAFITTEPDGQRVFDVDDWEGAVQQILAACREFKIPCGYPATAADIERRMGQGFTVFLMRWSDLGLQAIDLGRRAAGR